VYPITICAVGLSQMRNSQMRNLQGKSTAPNDEWGKVQFQLASKYHTKAILNNLLFLANGAFTTKSLSKTAKC